MDPYNHIFYHGYNKYDIAAELSRSVGDGPVDEGGYLAPEASFGKTVCFAGPGAEKASKEALERFHHDQTVRSALTCSPGERILSLNMGDPIDAGTRGACIGIQGNQRAGILGSGITTCAQTSSFASPYSGQVGFPGNVNPDIAGWNPFFSGSTRVNPAMWGAPDSSSSAVLHPGACSTPCSIMMNTNSTSGEVFDMPGVSQTSAHQELRGTEHVRQELCETDTVEVTMKVQKVVADKIAQQFPEVANSMKQQYVVERTVQVPVNVIKEVEKQVPKPEIIERVVEVPKVQLVEKQIPGPPQVRYEEEIIEVPQVVLEETIVHVPKCEFRERLVEVPRIEFVERLEYEDTVEYREVPVDKIVEVPQIEYIVKEVEHAVPQTYIQEYHVDKQEKVPLVQHQEVEAFWYDGMFEMLPREVQEIRRTSTTRSEKVDQKHRDERKTKKEKKEKKEKMEKKERKEKKEKKEKKDKKDKNEKTTKTPQAIAEAYSPVQGLPYGPTYW